MRLKGRIKMGYYPTPISVVDRIRTFLKYSQENMNFLDPCCGEGLALKNLAKDYKVTTYGIELDTSRAKEAKENLDYVLHCSYEHTRISNNAFSCLFLNPPYDWESKVEEEINSERKEKTFLRNTIKYLQPEGVLIYIISQGRLTESIAKILSYQFENFNIFRFPDDEYKLYKQLILLGTKRKDKYLNEQQTEKLKNIPFHPLEPIPYSKTPLYALPPSKKIPLFRSLAIDPTELEAEVAQSPLWKKLKESSNNNSVKRPPLPLHTGHVGLLLATGYLDGVVGEGKDRHIVRGKVEKTSSVYTEYQEGVEIQRETTNYKISLKILKKDGEILTLM
jgi:hypothetical protein